MNKIIKLNKVNESILKVLGLEFKVLNLAHMGDNIQVLELKNEEDIKMFLDYKQWLKLTKNLMIKGDR
ncbi:MAG: hypothetical protein ACRC30_08310 [Clostridium sp.]